MEGSGWRALDWSPDDRTLLFTCGGLCTVDAAGSAVQEPHVVIKTPDYSLDRALGWSPDGRRFSFSRGRVADVLATETDLVARYRAGKTGLFHALLGAVMKASGGRANPALVNRLVEPSAGQVLVDGRDVAGEDPVRLRRGIGYVIQQTGLFPHRTVYENVATVPRLLGWPEGRVRGRVSPSDPSPPAIHTPATQSAVGNSRHRQSDRH